MSGMNSGSRSMAASATSNVSSAGLNAIRTRHLPDSGHVLAVAGAHGL